MSCSVRITPVFTYTTKIALQYICANEVLILSKKWFTELHVKLIAR